MSTSVAAAFRAYNLVPEGVVPWGTRPPVSESGIYVVSLTPSTAEVDSCLDLAPLNATKFEEWLERCPDLTLDGAKPTIEQLMERVGRFWFSDEVILYVGLASDLSTRLRDYYKTPIGARHPHSGGYFLKLLSNLDSLYVHYARCADPGQAEHKAIGAFCAAVSPVSRNLLYDPAHPFPFANLVWPPGTRKAHGLKGARDKKQSEIVSTKRAARVPGILSPRGQGNTQPVTARDWRAGQIRIPVASKRMFPREAMVVAINLRGEAADVSWNPRTSPGQSRSGVLGIGRERLQRLVREGETLSVTSDGERITLA